MDLLRILQVMVGIGLVIFVHELGHFIAARWCGVRVHVFSLGFGPKLFGFRRGGVSYQISAVPLGGYVAMAGEHSDGDGSGPRPDDLRAKSVGQRFFIYSGGVLMNMVFALVVFPILFLGGVPYDAPVVAPEPGGPAWLAGVEEGDRIVSIGGTPMHQFNSVLTEVALGGSDPVELEVRSRRDGSVRALTIEPARDESLGIFALGVQAALDLELELGVDPNGPAFEAGLRLGDELLSVVGQPQDLKPLDQLRLGLNSEQPITIQVKRPMDGSNHDISFAPLDRELNNKLLGVGPWSNLVLALRGTAAEEAVGLEVGDRILTVANRQVDSSIDFLAGLAGAPTDQPVELLVQRADGQQARLSWPGASSAERARLADQVALGPDLENTLVYPSKAGAAQAGGVLAGDRVVRIDGQSLSSWNELQGAIANAARAGRPMDLEIERRGPADNAGSRETETIELSLSAANAHQWDYGFAVRAGNEYQFSTDSPVEALKVGFQSSIGMLKDGWLTLKRMLLAEVSTKNLGGIISISYVSYSVAEAGLAKLFYFLCLLSVNLAFVNVLPIPLLDGGHLLFLLLEKIKGSPVSERIMGYSQMVGLVLLVGLMVYVTYNDLMRVVFRG